MWQFSGGSRLTALTFFSRFIILLIRPKTSRRHKQEVKQHRPARRGAQAQIPVTTTHLLVWALPPSLSLRRSICRAPEAFFSYLPQRFVSGGVINADGRCPPRRYKQPNNGVLPGPDGSCCAGKNSRAAGVYNETEWDQQFSLGRRGESRSRGSPLPLLLFLLSED